jgi:hypothetical protein
MHQQRFRLGLILGLSLFALAPVFGRKGPGPERPVRANPVIDFRANCANATAQYDQEINNVRARLTNGGDVWWEGSTGRYVIPKVPPGVPEVSSLYAGAVWLGGRDPGGNLKVAAQQYGRSQGNFDYYPGPLVPETGTVERDTCARWDKMFTVSGENIRRHIVLYNQAVSRGETELDPNDIPDDILGWPATGNRFFQGVHNFSLPNTTQGLAGFFEPGEKNGIYEPEKGDYPVIEIRGCLEDPQFPDEMTFWIYNDAGNVHRESGTERQIQMEIQVQAFAFKTADDINNMTFQRYKLINRAQEDIDSTFFAMWVDADLGCAEDDFVGCDTIRSLAYVYNQDELDGSTGVTCGGIPTYQDEVPIIGIDYFRGPLDEFGNELGMSSFTYFNRASSDPAPPQGTTDPQTAQQYYNYLSGRWLDGTPYRFGGDGYQEAGAPVRYAFPDPPDDPFGWSMCSEGLPPGDRRTVQASGPFLLRPGAVNELIIGAVWVPEQIYPCPSIRRLQQADDVAQGLFDNCFQVPRGPDAPDVDWIELDQELIAVLTNDTLFSNNAFEAYSEIGLGISDPDSLYRFEGYKIFQFSGPEVTLADEDDPEKVRLVAQVDLRNGVQKVFNWNPLDPADGETPTEEVFFVPELRADGQDRGIRHTFRITEDQFAQGSRQLINHKKYYFTAIAYGYNNYKQFDQTDPVDPGQQTPYRQSTLNVGDGENAFYTVIPRPIVDRNLNSFYGQGPQITRLEGIGNKGNFLDISSETREVIEGTIRSGEAFSGEVTYEGGFGPVDVQVYNPLEVVDGEYEITVEDSNPTNNRLEDDARWVLRSLTDPAATAIVSERPIAEINEQVVAEYGFSVLMHQVPEVGAEPFAGNGVIGYDIDYAEERANQWLSGIRDNFNPQSGIFEIDAAIFDYVETELEDRFESLDPEQEFQAYDYWQPYKLMGWEAKENNLPVISPAWTIRTSQSNQLTNNRMDLEDLNNVDIVFTSDKSLWSRCPVVETANYFYPDFGFEPEQPNNEERIMLDLRYAPSVSREATADGTPQVDPNAEFEFGMGWFPGYAIDVETGKRLNIFFGENSTYREEYSPNLTQGADMMFNPVPLVYQPPQGGNPLTIHNFVAGAQHFVYVTNQEYDGGEELASRLRHENSPVPSRKRNALTDVTWVGFVVPTRPMLDYSEGLIPADVTVKLRVNSPYDVEEGVGGYNGYPTYRFKLEGFAPTELDEAGVNAALDQINVVPNPYYGFSDYEDSEFENIVKVTNLPPRAIVTIYTLDGKFIRQYNRDERPGVPNGTALRQGQIVPDLEWDLRNARGIPIASGVYLIHVAAPGLGERTLKWFGVNRQFDPSGL